MFLDAVSIGLRALGFVALFQATGTAFFLQCFSEPLASATRRRLRRWVVTCGSGAVVLVALHLGLEPARMGGGMGAIADPSLTTMVLESSQATAALWKVLGLALVVAGVARGTRAGDLAAALGASLAFAGFTHVGHVSIAASKALLGGVLWIHLAIAAFWFGSLLPLIAVARGEAAAVAAVVVEGFSRTAVWLVPVLAAAGLTLAVVLLRSPSALATPYGGVIVGKAVAFAVLMALAAFNRWRFGPALAAGEAAAPRAFSRTVAVEYVLIALVLVATALLTTLLSPES